MFTEVRISQECLLFMKCKPPIEPVEFSRRICTDAATVGHGGAQARYLNRLTPVSVIVKASENGLEDGARRVLAEHFKLKPKEGPNAGSVDSEGQEAANGKGEGMAGEDKSPVTVRSPILFSYACLLNSRPRTDNAHHSLLFDRRYGTTTRSSVTTSSNASPTW